jgi:hypothetical protein
MYAVEGFGAGESEQGSTEPVFKDGEVGFSMGGVTGLMVGSRILDVGIYSTLIFLRILGVALVF